MVTIICEMERLCALGVKPTRVLVSAEYFECMQKIHASVLGVYTSADKATFNGLPIQVVTDLTTDFEIAVESKY